MEKLYNNINIPYDNHWPPRYGFADRSPMTIPYLDNPPDVIDINCGRQLFVDDFLIMETDLIKKYHKAIKYEGNPVFIPETDAECNDSLPCACPKSGGIWYDENKFKMWYEAGWLNKLAYAESADGINWVRPTLDVVDGTNLILPGVECDSSAVFIDYDTKNKDERYKMFMRVPGGDMPGYAYTSPDGIHWSEPSLTSPLGDRSTMFYNPFRKKWVYSIRSGWRNRSRRYRECDDYIKGAIWSVENHEAVNWLACDDLDTADPNIGFPPQLYNFDAVAYESIMLGMFQIHLGPENDVCAENGYPKLTELIAAYSRDGFHFSRPDRSAFISASREKGVWDRGYVQCVGGICLINDDELWFYYIGFRGDETKLVTQPSIKLNGMHDYSCTGLAKLRRDGFVSLNGIGTLLTRNIEVDKEKKNYLFVNINGTVKAEIIDNNGDIIGESVVISGNHTCVNLLWNKIDDKFLSTSKSFRIKFYVEGELYSFWFSKDTRGNSEGYTAAGNINTVLG